MAPDREIYLLNPRDLSPEIIAVSFAKTSRSPLSFREIAAELSAEKSAEFHEKWVVGYGHASVAEHAVLHIAFENVSRLAIECIESNRLASYTEKSTRYQMWGPEDYHLPAELAQSPHAERYRKTCARLFAAYQNALPPLRALVEERFPRREDESRPRWQGRIRSKYVDVARYLLPAAALANVGMTANARAFEHAIRKMLSHPLQEVREIGVEVKAVALRETPTLVKYAEPVDYMQKTRVALQELGDGSTPLAAGDWLELADYDRSAEDKFLAACFYTGSGIPFSQALQAACGLASGEREQVARAALGELGRFDIPLRELEYVGYTFDAVMDQGAYFEVKRHRMMTQTPQRLTATLGYAVPRMFTDAGLLDEYRDAMDTAAQNYAAIAADFPEQAAYLVPNGFKRRLLMSMNLREAFHFCELRSAANAHFSVRILAGRMHEMICAVHPLIGAMMRWEGRADWRDIEREHFLG